LQDAQDRRDWTQLFLCDWFAAALIKLRILSGAKAAHMRVAAKNNEESVRKASPEMQEAARDMSLWPSYDVLETLMKYGGYNQRQI
jgi:hypothetical protein